MLLCIVVSVFVGAEDHKFMPNLHILILSSSILAVTVLNEILGTIAFYEELRCTVLLPGRVVKFMRCSLIFLMNFS